jgi:hypothetical protein
MQKPKTNKKVNERVKVDLILSNIQKKFDLSAYELIDLFKEEEKGMSVPVSIFSKETGMLESASLYMKDELKLSFNEISRLLKRNYKTIWTSYNMAKKKLKKVK